jgi:hypothetical protein
MHADKSYPVIKVQTKIEIHCVKGKSEDGLLWLEHLVLKTVSYYLYNYYIIEYYYYYSLLLRSIMEIYYGDEIKSKDKQSSEEHIINHGVREVYPLSSKFFKF